MRAESAAAEGFVLAGGQSSRMGRDKASLQINGRTLVEIALETMHSAGLPCRIAGAREDLTGYAPVVEDLHPGSGPLAGIEAALAATDQPLNVFLPVDLPLLPAGLLAWLLGRAMLTGALATVPTFAGRLHPLCAVYHRDLLPAVREALLRGDYKVTRVMARAAEMLRPSGAGLDVFSLETVAAAQPAMHSLSPYPMRQWFENCNTPQDLAQVASAAGRSVHGAGRIH